MSGLVHGSCRGERPRSVLTCGSFGLQPRTRTASYAMTVAGVRHVYSRPPAGGCHTRKIQAVLLRRFARSDVNYQIDARDLVGPLDSQVVEALHFVKRNMRVSATKATAPRGTSSVQ